MTGDSPGGAIDVATLEVLARRAGSHPLVADCTMQPDAISPRRLEVRLDAEQYPAPVTTVRLDVRWYDDGSYTLHYLESREGDRWQCRCDRHPKPGTPDEHFHPPPDASGAVERSCIETTDYLGVLFAVLDWAADRVATLHGD